jgi:hypothetical protein
VELWSCGAVELWSCGAVERWGVEKDMGFILLSICDYTQTYLVANMALILME